MSAELTLFSGSSPGLLLVYYHMDWGQAKMHF